MCLRIRNNTLKTRRSWETREDKNTSEGQFQLWFNKGPLQDLGKVTSQTCASVSPLWIILKVNDKVV